LFSDKTGTLTSNQLKLRACVIGNESFGISKEDYPPEENEEVNEIKFRDVISELKDSINEVNVKEKNINNQEELFKQQTLVSNFVLNMALNHTCYIKRNDNILKNQPNIELPLESVEDIEENDENNEYKVKKMFE